MTEYELRQKVVTTAKGWIGFNEANGKYKQIIDLYNNHKPLAQGYKVKYTDHWCATYVSAVFIKAGLADIHHTECSCPRMINLYRNKGRWKEADSYIPEPGDIIMYDWQDNGVGDNTGTADHVGIVASVSGSTIKVIEGNMSEAVGYRSIAVNGKYIRGYCLPDFASKATKETVETTTKSYKIDKAMSYAKSYAKTYTVNSFMLNMRSGAGLTKKIIKVLKKGDEVTCFGFFTKKDSKVWLLVQTKDGSTGFCSLNKLK